MINKEKLYSIGQASNKADVSTRTLRHYETIGLIKPDLVKENGYRYYTEDTILLISIIKYLQFMNFSLDEIRDFIFNADYDDVSRTFNELIKRTSNDIKRLEERLTIIKDWNELISEASSAFLIGNNTPSIKYIKESELISYPMDFDFHYEDTVLDLDFANFVKSKDNKITGPVMFYFDSYIKRLKYEKEHRPIKGLYIQKAVKPILDKKITFTIKDGFYGSIYHFGKYENLSKSYEKLRSWAKKYRYKLSDEVIERFVVDSWTFRDEKKYVTEILIPIEMKVEENK
ncbi:transcriptional regulator, MerR family [Anaerococcus hydrogenalis DSM 7454]|uniref:Transcriptional regulator, MerR family n=1 Tax=Anaerococcus hydrogenalis DSM 7454 TaxID=561177 RepID=B6W8H8_9FIRM|nr:MerR family transcriptional regulator [Anaerococcus hydrogenalis]EEB36249.1 transcriptional regulator, MerR family [Anaerococcus hydrogenalis DSM 7454]